MRNKNQLKIALMLLVASLVCACNKKDESYNPIPDAVYVTSNAITGTGAGANTTITNSASGKVNVTPAVARVYVNTLKSNDVTVNFTLSGTAVAGSNYVVPSSNAITIPAGKWYADIPITINNVAITGNRTIIYTLSSASNNTQLGIGSDRNYKVFTYTLTP